VTSKRGEIVGLNPVGGFRPVQFDQGNVLRREAEQRRRPAHRRFSACRRDAW
jgi:hypothetical protein